MFWAKTRRVDIDSEQPKEDRRQVLEVREREFEA
jgi:hypothetical protein